MNRRSKKEIKQHNINNEAEEPAVDRRSSGRIRTLSQRVRVVDSASREAVRSSAASARLESLEADNYLQEDPSTNPDDDEYVDLDNDDEVFGSKKKRQRRSAREMFKQTKKKKHSFPSFNAVLDETAFESFPAHVPNYMTAAVGPSKFPPKHFCSVCGFYANYTCTQCGTRFCSIKCNGTHKETRCLKFVS